MAGTSKKVSFGPSTVFSVWRADGIGTSTSVDRVSDHHLGPSCSYGDGVLTKVCGIPWRREAMLAIFRLCRGLSLITPAWINPSRRSLRALHLLVACPTNWW